MRAQLLLPALVQWRSQVRCPGAAVSGQVSCALVRTPLWTVLYPWSQGGWTTSTEKLTTSSCVDSEVRENREEEVSLLSSCPPPNMAGLAGLDPRASLSLFLLLT